MESLRNVFRSPSVDGRPYYYFLLFENPQKVFFEWKTILVPSTDGSFSEFCREPFKVPKEMVDHIQVDETTSEGLS